MHVIQIAKLKSALMPIWNGLNKSFVKVNINILSQIISDDVLVAILCYMRNYCVASELQAINMCLTEVTGCLLYRTLSLIETYMISGAYLTSLISII